MVMNKDKSISLYKIGKFYNAYNDDGIILHELLGYKYLEYKKSVGFPESALVKVQGKLESNNISYKIYAKEELISFYKGSNKAYDSVLNKAIKNMAIDKRISRAKAIIEKCTTEDLDKILEVIEYGKW